MVERDTLVNLCNIVAKSKRNLADVQKTLDKIYYDVENGILDYDKDEKEKVIRAKNAEQTVKSANKKLIDVTDYLMTKMSNIQKSPSFTKNEKDAMTDVLATVLDRLEDIL